MATALTVLWILAAFLALWGASLMWRGLWPAGRADKKLTCPACRKPVSGLACGACGFEGQSARDFRPPREWRLFLCGWIPVVAAVAAGYAAEVVRGWSLSDYSGHDVPLGPMQGAAIGVVVFALVLGTWSYRGDRSRGRRRCPKCWYDMSGSKLLCPECGHDAKSVKRLYRPRRRRRGVAAAAVLLVAAYGVWVAPRVKQGGPIAAVPTWVLIAGLPWWPDWMTIEPAGSYKENWTLAGRWSDLRLWDVDLWLLRQRARGVVSRGPTIWALSRAAHFLNERHDQDIAWRVHSAIVQGLSSADADERELAGWLQVALEIDDQSRRAIASSMVPLVAALDDPSPDVRAQAASYLSHLGEDAAWAFPKLIDSLRGTSGSYWRFFVPLWLIAKQSETGRTAILNATRHPDRNVRHACAYALGVPEAAAAGGTARLLEMLADPDAGVAQQAATSLCQAGADADAVVPAIFAWWRSAQDQRLRIPSEIYQFGSRLSPHMHLFAQVMQSQWDKSKMLRVIEWLTFSQDRPNFAPVLPGLKSIAAGPNEKEAEQARYILDRLSEPHR